MASLNNWLAFPLSSQQQYQKAALPSSNDADDVSTDCYSILNTFDTPHSHEWSMNESSSELSMLVNNNPPKLENFLGGHSFSEDSMYPANSNGIGMSMIKNWLRNQQVESSKNSGDLDSGSSNGGALVVAAGSQSLSLSMSTGSQSIMSSPVPVSIVEDDGKQKGPSGGLDAVEALPRKAVDTFGQRTSIYRGVTRHRWTGRYEAHLWDNSCRREGQTRKGRQVYLGGYDKEDKAARSYDLAALKYWGTTTTTNFPISNYEKELEVMKLMTRQEYVASLRRKSSGFSRGASIYRGVTRHHQHGRWQARIGRVAGNKDLYLGTFSTQEEAAEAYDIAAIKFRGLNAVTNFEMSRYDVNTILESSNLPIGSAAKRLKEASEITEAGFDMNSTITSHLSNGITAGYSGWPTIAFQQPQVPYQYYPAYGQSTQLGWCKQDEDLQHLHQMSNNNNTHNFFQPMNNMMSLDSSSVEHSTGSTNSIAYNGSYQGGYAMPISTMVVDPSNENNQASSSFGEDSETMYRYDQNGAWMVSSVQGMEERSGGDVGAPLFTMWNDA